ncbi:MAG: glycine/betaine ABC transporter substrate-binding protein [Rubellimicrobium sp.]|nr:glycine/betaine ABC transporter substrate-binding protein [Rubellimicrobium sp.]
MITSRIRLVALACAVLPAAALASDPDGCRTVRIGDGGWMDNAAQNGLAATILEAIGYDPEISFLALGVILESMKSGEIDVFLDSWTPNSDATLMPYVDAGAIRNVGTNLEGGLYALAVPAYAWEEGLRDFADIARFADELDNRIHALEPGNDSNNVLLQMIEENAFGLAGFELVEASEQAMIAAVGRAVDQHEPIVFVGWSPHPMNVRFDMRYLSGGDDWFGPNYGSASVWTGLRPGYADSCPNALRFFQNLRFTIEMESAVMQIMEDTGKDGPEAAREWLMANFGAVTGWLDGVTSFDGGDALVAARSALGVN